MRKILLALAFLVIIFAAAETIARVKGYRPYQYNPSAIKFEPRVIYKFDPLLGHKLDTGRYSITDENVKWTTTNNADGYRITSPDTTSNSGKPRIVFLGGASTYGQFMNDDETYAWLLQSKLPQYQVLNYAVPGYGLVHTYALITQLNKAKPGDILIYTYFSQQDDRPSRTNQKDMFASINEKVISNYHFISMDTGMVIHLNAYKYHPWPLSQYSAIINFAENAYNTYLDSHNPSHRVAKRAIVAMHDWSQKHGCTFLVIARRRDPLTRQTIEHCKEKGVKTVDFSDIRIESASDVKVTLKPGEHLNANANRIFADTLYSFLLKENMIDTTLSVK